MRDSLKILVVDDLPANRLLVSKYLQKQGYQVLEACDGQEAVGLYESEQPDMILLDVMMPGMNGYEAAQQIKARANGRWTPIIFLSALAKGEEQVKGLIAGGDDYLTKPVNLDVLDAKIMSMQRIVEMQQQLAQTTAELQLYHKQAEAEQETAYALMERMINQERLNDEMLQHWVFPASRFSGDIVAASRSSDGRLYVLQADSTGHGLTAALPLMPLSQIFYAMVAKGLPLSELVMEMNRRLKELMPVERFVAAALVVIDPLKKIMQVWNGGCPDMLLLDEQNRVSQRFTSRHVALGITDYNELFVETVVYKDCGKEQLVLYSDGLIEAKNSEGENFGEERVVVALEGASDEGSLIALINAMSLHLGESMAHDDISIVILRCQD
ncbi:PP2C family protein-serine/threonine phosphatase [Sulfuriflexus mobilis]|uniref:PP2C family protein-serine/threonine phosphatase n=1 Tax=Sulfuriflexus mobilis TaxID=1811807 RepID=UPI000F83C217|nr:fused response regulator/phosphatase [Sulfuriflexus mobilis]